MPASDAYGAKLDALSLERILSHIFRTNLANEEKASGSGPDAPLKRPTPICIWGSHGIGKTSLIKEFANRNGWKFRYCAPAQFEEMGDLHGLPVTHDPDPQVHGDETTIYLPPDWVPKQEDAGPGILLLDDINRADDRILRGLMQLLQEFEMFSWTLPPKWQIVCTGNPDSGDYSVTSMDDAMLTRMLHFTMVYDLKAWLAWANTHGVDQRGIAFLMTYPETVSGQRTTPRSLEQFFSQISGIPDLRKELELVSALAHSALDVTTATAFVAFVNDELSQLVNPEDILDPARWPDAERRLRELAQGSEQAKRVDRLSTICTRLALHLRRNGQQLDDRAADCLCSFVVHPSLPGDLRFSLHRDLVQIGGRVAIAMRREDVAKAITAVL
ncbi:ATP-binding protein [Synechococcus sp. CBW1006]|uniref:ATP-binding protein n=1 Tax=Synechococcus sp. CBW1006 TaxID=1353138 RepID=UPI0018CE669E|nr:AAA family ATPase [Synechococcus sp. CBW1006]QPN66569.1 AAA family ATPase [Synechococcus sp. CBW1006]